MTKLKSHLIILTAFCIMLVVFDAKSDDQLPVPMLQKELQYDLDLAALKRGDFQYFYSLLKQDHHNFENLYRDICDTQTDEIVETFLPLDTKKMWNSKEENYLAVAKLNYILPTSIEKISEERINSVQYLQKTMPKNEVTKHDTYYHVDGTFLTPEFHLYLQFLEPQHPILKVIKNVDLQKIQSGKMKVTFQHQDKFGRVMMFKTAKMASAVNIYEHHGPGQTIVTSYILSNIINVPTQNMIKEGMIKNMQHMVRGSRIAVKEF
jgi:hypothetical protein